MDKMGYARGLIRYSTDNAMREGLAGAQMVRRLVRPRVLIYAAILAAVVSALLLSFYLRVPLKVDVIRDRATLTRETADGWVENVYRLQIMNTREQAHRYRIVVAAPKGLQLIARQPVEVAAVTTTAVPVTVRADPAMVAPGSHAVTFRIEDLDDPTVAVNETSRFFVKK
jgi:polyferredoxin